MSLLIGIAALYLLVLLLIGYCSARTESQEDYLIGGRQFKAWSLTLSLCSTWTTSSWLFFVMALTLQDSMAYFWANAGLMLGVLALAILAPRINAYAKIHSIHSLAEYIHVSQGKYCGQLAGYLSFSIYMGWLMLELVAAGALLSAFTELSYLMSIFLLTVVVALYLLFGGFKALVQTDQLQFVMVMGFAAIVMGLLWQQDMAVINWSDFVNQSQLSPWGAFITLAGIFPIIFFASEVWQRAMAAKDGVTARKSLLITSILQVLPYLPFIILAWHFSGADLAPQEIILALFNGQVAPILGALAFVFMLAMIMSSVDSLSFIAGQSIANDGLGKIILTGKNPALKLRFGIIACLLLSAIFALFFRDIVDIFYLMFAFWMAYAPTIWPLLLRKPPSSTATLLTMLVMLGSNLIMQLVGIYTDAIGVGVFVGGLILPFVLDWVGRIARLTNMTFTRRLG